MVKSRVRSLTVLCIFMASVGITLLVAYRITTSIAVADTSVLETPTIVITPKLMYKVPGWEQIVVSQTSWSSIRPELTAQNYAVTLFATGKSGIQQYTVEINTSTQKNFDVESAMINGTVYVMNDRIEYTVLSVLRSGIGKDLAGKDWQLVDPTVLFSNYGVPDDFLMDVGTTGEGLAASIVVMWKQRGVTMFYSIRTRPQDVQGKAVQLCLLPDRISEALILATSPGKDSLQIVQEDLHIFPTLKFKSSLFTGINDLNGLTRALVDGKCLEAQLSLWQR